MDKFYPADETYKLKRPFWHAAQKRAFDRSCNEENFAIWHEPRCGKSDIVVQTCCRAFQRPAHPRHIRGLVAVVYPSGGQIGWVKDAFPEAATVPWRGIIWDSAQVRKRSFARAFKETCETDHFAVLAINIEALISLPCREAIGEFASHRKLIMAVGDESGSISNKDARRSKIMHNIAKLPFTKMRRVLDGTPAGRKGPLDFYSQMGFLDWNILGYPNQVEFEAHYAVKENKGRGLYWREVNRLTKWAIEKNFEYESKTGRLIYEDPREWAEKAAKSQSVVDETGRKRRLVRGRDYWSSIKEEDGQPVFKNMDEFWTRMDPVSDRCTFAAAFPNARRPIFAKRYFELTNEQRRVYDDIDNEYKAVLKDGTTIDAVHQLTRTLRLQQVTSNYYPDKTLLKLHEACGGIGCEDCGDSGTVEIAEPLKLIDEKCNPRMDALTEELKEGVPTIVWVRFRQDALLAMNVAVGLGLRAVRYDGSINTRQKLENRTAFQAGEADVIVGNWASMSRAIPLHAARKHVCVSNGWSFFLRKQGEERSEHGTKTIATSFVDLVALDTVDDLKILPALRQGMDVSTYVLRDEKREWL